VVCTLWSRVQRPVAVKIRGKPFTFECLELYMEFEGLNTQIKEKDTWREREAEGRYGWTMPGKT